MLVVGGDLAGGGPPAELGTVTKTAVFGHCCICCADIRGGAGAARVGITRRTASTAAAMATAVPRPRWYMITSERAATFLSSTL